MTHVVTHCYMLMQVFYCMLCQIVELFCCSFLGKPTEELAHSVSVLEDKTVKYQGSYLISLALLLCPLVFQLAPWLVNFLMTSEIAALTAFFSLSLSTERINP